MEAKLNECTWTQEEEESEVWLTDCGEIFCLEEDDEPLYGGVKYCCFCGKSIASVAIVWDGESYVKGEPKRPSKG